MKTSANDQKLTIGRQVCSVRYCLLKSVDCDKNNTAAYKMLYDKIEEMEKRKSAITQSINTDSLQTAKEETNLNININVYHKINQVDK
jgi:hypothetical protein